MVNAERLLFRGVSAEALRSGGRGAIRERQRAGGSGRHDDWVARPAGDR